MEKIKLKIKQNPNPRAHRVLFDPNSPFKPKQVKSPLEYQRNPKHRNKGNHDE
jgi:hypothetical protein